MGKFTSRLGISFLTFAIGMAIVSVLMFRAQADQAVIVEPVVTDPGNGPVANSQKTLEMVFVVDTTGSMGGLIEGAKTKIWSIVNDVMQRQDHPQVKVGLVAYRDNGDEYVTQITPLTNDLDAVYSKLMDFRADGGGDTPENVRRALADGVEKAGWSKVNQNTAQILFLVGDAPPQNYEQEPDVLVTTAKAVRQNMIINTIQCGAATDTRQIWQQVALRGEGKFFAIAQDGGVQNITSPYDARLAELANEIGSTYLAYGGGEGEKGVMYRKDKQAAQVSTESKVAANAAPAAQADRALNKAINERAYSDDLVQSIENNEVKLEEVKDADLPENMKKMSATERKQEVEKRLTQRKKLRAEIVLLSKKRDEYLKVERAKSGKADGFDSAVSSALKEQMARKGIK